MIAIFWFSQVNSIIMVAWIRFRILFYIKWTYLSGKFFITRFPSTWKGSNQFKEYWRIQPSAKVHQHSFVLDFFLNFWLTTVSSLICKLRCLPSSQSAYPYPRIILAKEGIRVKKTCIWVISRPKWCSLVVNNRYEMKGQQSVRLSINCTVGT